MSEAEAIGAMEDFDTNTADTLASAFVRHVVWLCSDQLVALLAKP